jgi:hypothetical protein
VDEVNGIVVVVDIEDVVRGVPGVDQAVGPSLTRDVLVVAYTPSST